MYKTRSWLRLVQ